MEYFEILFEVEYGYKLKQNCLVHDLDYLNKKNATTHKTLHVKSVACLPLTSNVSSHDLNVITPFPHDSSVSHILLCPMPLNTQTTAAYFVEYCTLY